MEKLNVVSKLLGVSKGKIKDMCKSGEITFEIVNGVYYVDMDEVQNLLNNNSTKSKRKNRVTIFTVDMRNTQTIIRDLKTLSEYGRKGTKGLGSFANVVEMAKVGMKNNFIVDKGGIIDEYEIPSLYEEIRNGTNRESSMGSLELQKCVIDKIRLDWGIWLMKIKDDLERETTIHHLMDVYFLSTSIYSVNKVNSEL